MRTLVTARSISLPGAEDKAREHPAVRPRGAPRIPHRPASASTRPFRQRGAAR